MNAQFLARFFFLFGIVKKSINLFEISDSSSGNYFLIN